MKPIDRKQAEKALESIQKVQRRKPLLVVLGVGQLALAVLLGFLLHWYAGLPIEPEGGGYIVFIIAGATFGLGFLIIQTTTLFCLILAKNNKDILLTYLAQRQLQAEGHETLTS
ncbi:MAG: hypothetical protein JW709_04335 [Sedimentisphaerales bacterium]|nr:hypothetical protein [Sedimentisphaerales bacterium]